MISWDAFMDVKSLASEGVSKREIARRTGFSRNTVRKVLRGEHPMRMKAAERCSKLDPYKDRVRERDERYGLSAVRLIEEIRPLGYDGSIVTLRRYLKTHPVQPQGWCTPRRAGETFSGTVRYVGDGDTLCVGQSDDPRTWIGVRLADFDAPDLHSADGARSKRFLVAMGREASWRAQRGRSGRVVVHDRVIAVCISEGHSIGDLLRTAGHWRQLRSQASSLQATVLRLSQAWSAARL